MSESETPTAVDASPAGDPALVFGIMVKVPGRSDYQHFSRQYGGRLTVREHAERMLYTEASSLAAEIELQHAGFSARVVSFAIPKYPKARLRISRVLIAGGGWPLMNKAMAAMLAGRVPAVEVTGFYDAWRTGSFDDYMARLAGLVTLAIENESES